ncbi:MAG: transglutaminase family protein [Desulfobacterales bacterium]|jgi:transglutaminase-like putative cysteine protease
MNYRIRHETRYTYTENTAVSYNEVRLSPRNLATQTLIGKTLTAEPPPAELRERLDYFGNPTWFLAIDQPHKVMTVVVESHVRITGKADMMAIYPSLAWETAREQVHTATDPDTIAASEFILDSPLIEITAQLRAYAQPSFSPQRPQVEAVCDLMQRIHEDFEFRPGFTDTSTPLDEVLKHRRGVCQDFAQLGIGCLRSMGLPARYVSGYIETLPPPGKEKLKGADASHAWFGAYVPGFGWIDFDPTNNQVPSDQHIVVAMGRDFSDVTPIKGVIFGAGQHELSVAVDVERHEKPSATR